MDFNLYQYILRFHRHGAIPQVISLNRQNKFNFREACSRYIKTKLNLIDKRTGLRVLHSRIARIITQKLHRDHEHNEAVQLERLNKEFYKIQGARRIFLEITRSCDNCIDQAIHPRLTIPFIHGTSFTLGRICKDLGLFPSERPLLEENCFKSASSLDLTAFIPKTVITIDPDFNCMCAVHLA